MFSLKSSQIARKNCQGIKWNININKLYFIDFKRYKQFGKLTDHKAVIMDIATMF